jgi:nucleotide-binding universal stress UspA family protein
VQYIDSAQRLQHVLDEATARMPDPPVPLTDANDVAQYWREGRQALWQLVENERKQLSTAAEIQKAAAAKRAHQLQQRVHAALAPAAPLRQRAGQWLYDLGVRISARGAS